MCFSPKSWYIVHILQATSAESDPKRPALGLVGVMRKEVEETQDDGKTASPGSRTVESTVSAEAFLFSQTASRTYWHCNSLIMMMFVLLFSFYDV